MAQSVSDPTSFLEDPPAQVGLDNLSAQQEDVSYLFPTIQQWFNNFFKPLTMSIVTISRADDPNNDNNITYLEAVDTEGNKINIERQLGYKPFVGEVYRLYRNTDGVYLLDDSI